MIAALRVTVGTGEKSADGTRLKSRLGDFCNWVRTSRGVFLTQVCWSAAVWGGKEKEKEKKKTCRRASSFGIQSVMAFD